MALRSQIVGNCRALLKHSHQNQMVRRFSQVLFRPITTSFHLPVHRRDLGPNPDLLRPHALNMSSQTSPNPPQDSSPPTKTMKVVITGRVQNVHYRDWAVENATQLGLKGWVRNRGDGSVEVLVSGESDKVEEMKERCRTGPPLCIVTKFEADLCNEDPGTVFERRVDGRIRS